MKCFEWNDGMKHRSRTPHLVLVEGDRVEPFRGAGITSMLGVIGSSYTKNGKWSHTVWQLAIADTVTAIEILEPWEGWGATLEDLKKGFSRVESDDEIVLSDDFVIRIITENFKEGGYLRGILEKALENKAILESLK